MVFLLVWVACGLLNQNKGRARVPILGDIPIARVLFQSISKTDMENMLHIFVKAKIIPPSGVFTQGTAELDGISQEGSLRKTRGGVPGLPGPACQNAVYQRTVDLL